MRKSDGQIIDINATAHKLGDKSLQLLAIHALTGCDTTSYLFGKGKASAVSIMLKHDMNLEVLGQTDANLCDVISAGHRFFSILYSGKQSTTTMNLLRHTIFISKRDTPKIKTLPPTDSALDEHIKRAHLQTMIWKAADEDGPPEVNITAFGWNIIDNIPKPRTGMSEVAPPELMKVVACGCCAQNACSSNICSCHAARLSCTSFCKCIPQNRCHNPNTRIVEEGSEDENDTRLIVYMI